MFETESEDDDIQYYRLDGWKLITCSLGDWADSLAKEEHVLEDSDINLINGRLVRVVTCLLGYDIRHDYEEEDDQLCSDPTKRLLFETMIIGLVDLPVELHDYYSSTVLEAKQAHYRMLTGVREHLKAKSLLDSSQEI